MDDSKRRFWCMVYRLEIAGYVMSVLMLIFIGVLGGIRIHQLPFGEEIMQLLWQMYVVYLVILVLPLAFALYRIRRAIWELRRTTSISDRTILAVKTIQANSIASGRSALSDEEIDAEITAVRRGSE